MSPYAPLFSNPIDIAIAWFLVAAWLAIGAALFRVRSEITSMHPEDVCSAAAQAFLALVLTIMLIYIFGLVFLVYLKIQSFLWAFWELFFLMSVTCVFRVLPFFAIGLLCWAFFGKQKANYSPRNLHLALACLFMTLIDGALYFWLSTLISAA